MRVRVDQKHVLTHEDWKVLDGLSEIGQPAPVCASEVRTTHRLVNMGLVSQYSDQSGTRATLTDAGRVVYANHALTGKAQYDIV